MKEKGKRAEEEAIAYLKRKGYSILERNYFTRFGEIDVVAKKDGFIVFIEVKSSKAWDAEYNITLHKAKKLYKAAMVYLSRKGFVDLPFRFDLIAINGGNLNHYENILGEGGVFG